MTIKIFKDKEMTDDNQAAAIDMVRINFYGPAGPRECYAVTSTFPP